jgi:hypothetical protein
MEPHPADPPEALLHRGDAEQRQGQPVEGVRRVDDLNAFPRRQGGEL